MLSAEIELQLKVAADAVKQIRSAVAGLAAAAQQKAESFLPRIKLLQSELASVTDSTSSTLHEKYRSLCGEILAAQEKSSPL